MDHNEELVDLIENAEISVSEWNRHREIQFRKFDADILELGFSTFFLNRTNRSGIIHSGGIIGGKAQSGEWKMDCRFNKSDLSKRVRRIAKYRNRITAYNEDAEIFMDRLGTSIPQTAVIYIDPPYYEKGSQLYKNSYRKSDHERIAERVSRLESPWLLTYDNVPEIRKLYTQHNCVELDIGYSVQTKRRGSEILVTSNDLLLPVTDEILAH